LDVVTQLGVILSLSSPKKWPRLTDKATVGKSCFKTTLTVGGHLGGKTSPMKKLRERDNVTAVLKDDKKIL